MAIFNSYVSLPEGNPHKVPLNSTFFFVEGEVLHAAAGRRASAVWCAGVHAAAWADLRWISCGKIVGIHGILDGFDLLNLLYGYGSIPIDTFLVG